MNQSDFRTPNSWIQLALTTLILMTQLIAPDGHTSFREYALGYDDIQETTRRKAATVNLKNEDEVLERQDRAKLISAARNSSLCTRIDWPPRMLTKGRASVA